jgi:hypothetical protein
MEKVDFRPETTIKIDFQAENMPKIDFKPEKNLGIQAYEPSYWEAIKEHILFPTEEGYGGRWTKPTREEKYLYRPLTFLPRVGFKIVNEALDRANRLFTGAVEPAFAAVSKQIGVREPEAQSLWPSVKTGFRAAIRKPGEPTEAPTYGEAWGRSWYEPLVGKKPPQWMETAQDVAFETVLLLGPSAVKAARQRRLTMQLAKTTTEYEAARLKPTKFKEPWKTVSGKEYKAGEALFETLPPGPQAPSPILTEGPVQKLTRLINSAERVEKAQRKLRHKEMQARVGRLVGELEKGKGEQAFYKAKGALKGALPTAEFTPPKLEMSPAEMNALVEQVRVSNKLLPLQKINAHDGLQQIFAGQIPQRSKLVLLEREFGPELVKAALGKRAFSAKAFETVIDAANLPRTFLTAYDLSASMRQTYISATRHPIKWSKAFVAQLKAFGSEKNALAIQNGIRNSKYYAEAVRNGLYLPDVSTATAPLSARPEEYMSRLARHLPGIKASERAFVTMGNKMRFELYSKYSALWEGTSKTAADYKSLATYLNAVTGRGSLGTLEQYGAGLNAVLFSPRYLTSRFQVLGTAAKYPYYLATGKSPVAKIAAGDMAAFVGTNLSVLSAMKFYWGDDVDVEIDPRSSDFGKLRIGNSRFDLWAGYQPIVRYTVQAWTAQRKATLTDRVSDIPRMDTAGRFLRSKLAPVPSFIVDLKTGTTFIGDELSIAALKKSPPENLAFQKFFPLAGQDIWDAVTYQGGEAAWLTIPAAILGIGTGTWEPTSYQKLALQQDELAKKYYGNKWENLGPLAQRLLTKTNPELELLKQEADYERTKFPFLGRQIEEERAVGKRVESNLPKPVQTEMTRLKISVKGLSEHLGDWRLNEERYQQYQDLVVENITKDAERVLQSKFYVKSSDKFKSKRLENLVKNAKEKARQQITQQAKRQDVKNKKEKSKLLFRKTR